MSFFQQLDQTTGDLRLGRHVLHDPRSKLFDATAIAKPRPLSTTIHKTLVVPWDQGNIGCCTTNAALGCLMTEPLYNGSWHFTEADAQQLYRVETRLDDSQIPGHWEPTDTGSTFLWSARALKAAGWIKSYHHAFRLSTVLHLLQDRPVSTGITWYRSMFNVDSDNTIEVDFNSPVAGGHQVCLVGFDVDRQAVRLRNSWSVSWGDGGYAWLKWSDYDRLLADHGDAGVFVV